MFLFAIIALMAAPGIGNPIAAPHLSSRRTFLADHHLDRIRSALLVARAPADDSPTDENSAHRDDWENPNPDIGPPKLPPVQWYVERLRGWGTCSDTRPFATLGGGTSFFFQNNDGALIARDTMGVMLWTNGVTHQGCVDRCDCILIFQEDGNLVTVSLP